MTATPGQVLGTLLLTFLLRLTDESECYPQRPSERAGITKPSHLVLQGRSSYAVCLPARVLVSCLFLSVDLVDNGDDGSFGGQGMEYVT